MKPKLKLKMEIIARPFAERLISLSTRAPVVQLTGAEIAVLLGSLDDVDKICVEVLNRITGVKATEKRFEEIIKNILWAIQTRQDGSRDNGSGDGSGIGSGSGGNLTEKEVEFLAREVLERLKKLWILRTAHAQKELHIPKGREVSIRITRDSSFLLFAGRDLKRWLKKRKDTIFVSGAALGYAYCKSRSDSVIRMALEIARELSVENPLMPLKEWHFECVHPAKLEMCEECLADMGRKRREWVRAGRLAVNLYKLYQTESGRAALYILRREMCKFGTEEDERRLKAIKNYAVRNAEKRIDELRLRLSPLEISRLPVEKDDSASFINYPEYAVHGKRICGLALSIAASWYEGAGSGGNGGVSSNSNEVIGDDSDCEAVDSILRAVMDARHVITPDFRDAMRLLAERVRERNRVLSN